MSRYAAYIASIALTLASLLMARSQPGWWWGVAIFAALALLGTLDLLQQLGRIRPVYQGTGAAHYILMVKGRHHHLLCSACDRLVEFDECAASEMEAQIRERFQFEIQGHLLEIYGLCPECQEKG